MADKNDFILEEYRTVCREIEYLRKIREYFTVLTLSSGITILGYAIAIIEKESNLDVFLYIISFTLFIFVLGYIHHVARWLLAKKAESYIEYFFTLEDERFRWHIRKAGYPLGFFYTLYRCVVPLLYILATAGNLYLFFEYKRTLFFLFLPFVIIVITITTMSYSYSFYSIFAPDFFIKRWKSQEVKANEKIEKWIQNPSSGPEKEGALLRKHLADTDKEKIGK